MNRDAREVAQGLRELADWLDAHPDAKPFMSDYHMTVQLIALDADALAGYARMMAPCEKGINDVTVYLVRRFAGGVRLRASAIREKVCTKRVHTETVEVTEPEGEDTRPLVTRSVEREVVSWDWPDEGALSVPCSLCGEQPDFPAHDGGPKGHPYLVGPL